MSPTIITICILAIIVIFLIIWNIVLTVDRSKWASVDYVDKYFLKMGELAYKNEVSVRSVTYQYQYTIPPDLNQGTHGTTRYPTDGTSGRICHGIDGICPYGMGMSTCTNTDKINLQELLNMLLDFLELEIEPPSRKEKYTLIYCPGKKKKNNGDPNEN